MKLGFPLSMVQCCIRTVFPVTEELTPIGTEPTTETKFPFLECDYKPATLGGWRDGDSPNSVVLSVLVSFLPFLTLHAYLAVTKGTREESHGIEMLIVLPHNSMGS